MEGLPTGWATVALLEIIDSYQAGFASGEKDVQNGLAHLRMNNIGIDGSVNLDLVRTVPSSLANESHILQKNDILFCTTNSAKLVGKCALFKLDGRFAFSNHLTKIRCNALITNSHYLQKYLFYLWTQGEFEDKCKHWVNQSTLPKEQLLSTEILLPSLQEQLRIVAKLEKLLHKVDACQERLENFPALLKRFRQSILAAACSGRLTASWRVEQHQPTRCEGEDFPDGWSFSCVGEVVESLKYGTAKKCTYMNQGVPVLRIPNIVEGIISHTDLKHAELQSKELQQLSLQSGDILVVRSNGSVSLVGKSALVRESEKDFAYAGYLIRLRPNIKRIEPEYLNLVLGSYQIRIQIEVPARSTSGVNNINSDELRALSFLLPPLPEQQEIVRRVEALFAVADRIEARYKKAKAQVDRLTQSILAKAFRGELVPQNPDDEPASVLLERIRAEKTKAEPAKRQIKSRKTRIPHAS